MPHSTAMLLWGAFCISQLIFGGLSWFLWEGLQPENALTVWVIASMALPLTAMSTFGAGFLIREEGAARTRWILRLAFAESVATFGLVCNVLGGPLWLGPAMAGWAFLLMFIAIPKEDASL